VPAICTKQRFKEEEAMDREFSDESFFILVRNISHLPVMDALEVKRNRCVFNKINSFLNKNFMVVVTNSRHFRQYVHVAGVHRLLDEPKTR